MQPLSWRYIEKPGREMFFITRHIFPFTDLLYQSERCDASSRRCEFSRSPGDLFCCPPLRSKASLSGSHRQDLEIENKCLES